MSFLSSALLPSCTIHVVSSIYMYGTFVTKQIEWDTEAGLQGVGGGQ